MLLRAEGQKKRVLVGKMQGGGTDDWAAADAVKALAVVRAAAQFDSAALETDGHAAAAMEREC